VIKEKDAMAMKKLEAVEKIALVETGVVKLNFTVRNT
jgi:hypothetical protein